MKYSYAEPGLGGSERIQVASADLDVSRRRVRMQRPTGIRFLILLSDPDHQASLLLPELWSMLLMSSTGCHTVRGGRPPRAACLSSNTDMVPSMCGASEHTLDSYATPCVLVARRSLVLATGLDCSARVTEQRLCVYDPLEAASSTGMVLY